MTIVEYLKPSTSAYCVPGTIQVLRIKWEIRQTWLVPALMEMIG